MLSEEEVARLSGEVAWLKEETRYGDRKVGELEEQVINCARLLMTSANFPFILQKHLKLNKGILWYMHDLKSVTIHLTCMLKHELFKLIS